MRGPTSGPEHDQPGTREADADQTDQQEATGTRSSGVWPAPASQVSSTESTGHGPRNTP